MDSNHRRQDCSIRILPLSQPGKQWFENVKDDTIQVKFLLETAITGPKGTSAQREISFIKNAI